jgi:hypothetical protein
MRLLLNSGVFQHFQTSNLKKECNTLITPLPNPPRKRGGCAVARVGLSLANIFSIILGKFD